MAADIAESGRAKQRVADRVRERIAIRVASGSFFERDPHPANHEFAAGDKAVNVAAEADSQASEIVGERCSNRHRRFAAATPG